MVASYISWTRLRKTPTAHTLSPGVLQLNPRATNQSQAGTGFLSEAGGQRVYIRQRWADSWTLQPNLYCEQVTWSLLPSMPTASLVYYYGRIMPQGSLGYVTHQKVDLRGYYVKIEIECSDGNLVWYGFIDEQNDERGGTSVVSTGTGKQTFVCYSMVQMLEHTYMTSSKWWDQPNTTLRTSGSSITFNAKGMPNRTSAIPSAASSYVFVPRAPKNRLAGANKPWNDASYWSSADILDYVENYLAPQDSTGAVKIPIAFVDADATSAVPDWDRPTIQTEGRSVLSLINQIVNPARLMQISVTVNEATTPNTVTMNIHSLSATVLTLPNGETHPANKYPLTITSDGAHDTNTSIRASTTRLSHQVIVKGAKRESCLTAQIAKSGTEKIFAEGWTSAQESEYNTAASTQSGYNALTTTDKRQWDAMYRAKDSLDDVFKTFVIYPKWNGYSISGIGAIGWVFAEKNPTYDPNAFLPDPDAYEWNQYYPYWQEINISPNLPFKIGFDYSGFDNPGEADDGEAGYRTPYVIFKRPGSQPEEYLQAEKMSNGEDPSFSVGVGITKEGQGITLDVLGTHQHSIAATRFTALPADQEVGDWDYLDAYLTVSLTEDRYAEGRYPADADLSSSVDVIRQRVIYAGDGYKLARVLPETIVDVDNNGFPIRTKPGLTTSGEFLQDDTPKLKTLARLAGAWYLVDRKVFTLRSARPSAKIFVGQLLTQADNETIQTVVSQIAINTPIGEGGPAQAVSYELQTALGEVDPLQFIPDSNQRRRGRRMRRTGGGRATRAR